MRWDARVIRERCREIAGIEPGLRISVDDDAFCDASLGAYLRDGRVGIEPLDVHVIENDVGVRAAIAWHAGRRSIRTLVNGSPSGGVLVDAFHEAVRAVFARRLGRRVAYDQIARGMLAILHVTLDDPRWRNPTREWLENPEVGAAVRTVIERELARHFDEVPAALAWLLERVRR